MTDLVFGNVIFSGENFCVQAMGMEERKSGCKLIKNRKGHTKCDIMSARVRIRSYDIMSASEPESCLQI